MIHSRANAFVKQARALRERKAREATGLFLVEGIHHVGEAVAAGWEIETILFDPESLKSEFARELLAKFAGRQVEVSGEIMEYVSTKENPAGILAVVRQRSPGLRDLGQVRQGVALVAPQDPGNIGTILRTMDAVGCDALVILDGGADPYHPTAIRAAMGASFWKPVVRASFDSFYVWSRENRIQNVGTSAHGTESYVEFRPTEPWMLLLGSEQKGLSEAQLRACNVVLSLPMKGRTSSLNLGVAAGVFLYHFGSVRTAHPPEAAA